MLYMFKPGVKEAFFVCLLIERLQRAPPLYKAARRLRVLGSGGLAVWTLRNAGKSERSSYHPNGCHMLFLGFHRLL